MAAARDGDAAGKENGELAADGSTKATVAGASESNWTCCAEFAAGAAGIGCGFGAVFFMQQLAPPQ